MILLKKIINPLALHDRIFRYVFFVGAPILNFFAYILVFLKIFPLRQSRDVFALHYNIYFGIDLVGEWYKIFLLPLIGTLFLGINFIVASIAYRDHRDLSYLAIGITIFAEILIFVAAFLVVLLNI